MCEVNVYLLKQEKEELLMKNVAGIRLDGTEVCLRGVLGEEKRIKGQFKEADLMEHKIIFAVDSIGKAV